MYRRCHTQKKDGVRRKLLHKQLSRIQLKKAKICRLVRQLRYIIGHSTTIVEQSAMCCCHSYFLCFLVY